MAKRQMSASDVARAIWGSVPDPRGYSVAKNRDRIGAYLAGTGYPSRETLPKLAEAVGLSLDELPMPVRSTAARSVAAGGADVSFALLQDHPGLCSVYVRTVLSIDVGLKIIELVQADRGASSWSEGAVVTPAPAPALAPVSPEMEHSLKEMLEPLVQKLMGDRIRDDREIILTKPARSDTVVRQ